MEKQFDVIVTLLRSSEDLKVDSYEVTESDLTGRSITVKSGKKTAIITETDENWGSLFGLLNMTIGDKEFGLQSAVNTICILQDQLK